VARLRVAALISGRGSNLQALIDACRQPDFPAEIVLVVSNVPDAAGLERAARVGIPTKTIDHRAFQGREPFEDALDAALSDARVELVCLAGFMRILTTPFVQRWQGKLINIHPSLLPKYPGLDTHARAIADGEAFAGCTVHYVVPEVDAGPVIVQASVRILPDDTAATLTARVLKLEHRCYPLALQLIAEERQSGQ
jgi:phosphoribosylglycinamide formyltransferase-1